MRGILVLSLLGALILPGCAVVAGGAMAGAAAGVTYTALGTAEKTFPQDRVAVLAAIQKALGTLDIKTGRTRNVEEGGQIVRTEIEGFARDLTIQIVVERVTERATRVTVDASRKYVFKDRGTATEILSQTTQNLPHAS
jgi:hypothetical protein